MAIDPAVVEIAPALQRWAAVGWENAGGRLTTHWGDVIKRDPMLAGVVMVFELVFGGRAGGATRVRFATVPLRSASTTTGTRYDALPLLEEEPDIQQSYQLGVGSSAARAVAFTVDPLFIKPMDLIRNGIPLAGVIEVSLEAIPAKESSDANHDRRLVILRGDIDGSVRFGAQVGLERELMELEGVDPRASTNTRLPPWIMDEDRFASVHESAVGARVPVILNGFNGIPAQRITQVLTGANEFVFAHGHGFTVEAGPSPVSGVYVNGERKDAADATYGWAAQEDEDAFGVQFSKIRFTNGATAWEDSDAVHVDTTRSDDLNYVQVIRYILVNFSAFGLDGINESLFAETDARFPFNLKPRICINGASGNSATNVLEWIESGYLQALPMISMVFEGGGYGPILTDHRLDPVSEWEAGRLPLLDRVSLVEETSKDAIRNDFVIRYDYDALTGDYLKVRARTRDNSDVCAYSQKLFGRSDAEPIEAPYIADDNVADYVLDWLVEHQAQPSYLVQYEAAASVFLTHRRGDVVFLTDNDFGWADERATIQDITYRRGKCEVMLRVWLRFMDLGGQALSV